MQVKLENSAPGGLEANLVVACTWIGTFGCGKVLLICKVVRLARCLDDSHPAWPGESRGLGLGVSFCWITLRFGARARGVVFRFPPGSTGAATLEQREPPKHFGHYELVSCTTDDGANQQHEAHDRMKSSLDKTHNITGPIPVAVVTVVVLAVAILTE